MVASGEKLLSSAIKAAETNVEKVVEGFDGSDLNSLQGSFLSGSTGSASFYSGSSSGPKILRKKPRGRPSQWRRKAHAMKKVVDAKAKELSTDLVEVQES